ncbi:MAG: hypothetical protein KDD52_09400 [Bdellovibrionales bacterium]|nr:hypothetical protein [Bdellovibrionales bacterium]
MKTKHKKIIMSLLGTALLSWSELYGQGLDGIDQRIQNLREEIALGQGENYAIVDIVSSYTEIDRANDVCLQIYAEFTDLYPKLSNLQYLFGPIDSLESLLEKYARASFDIVNDTELENRIFLLSKKLQDVQTKLSSIEYSFGRKSQSYLLQLYPPTPDIKGLSIYGETLYKKYRELSSQRKSDVEDRTRNCRQIDLNFDKDLKERRKLLRQYIQKLEQAYIDQFVQYQMSQYQQALQGSDDNQRLDKLRALMSQMESDFMNALTFHYDYYKAKRMLDHFDQISDIFLTLFFPIGSNPQTRRYAQNEIKRRKSVFDQGKNLFDQRNPISTLEKRYQKLQYDLSQGSYSCKSQACQLDLEHIPVLISIAHYTEQEHQNEIFTVLANVLIDRIQGGYHG